ncbi:MAG: hypothetical protein LUG64_02185 [Clostridiales bacterium]|nr:hypothetical protein [Clostridiales bacterium]
MNTISIILGVACFAAGYIMAGVIRSIRLERRHRKRMAYLRETKPERTKEMFREIG